MRNKYSDCPVQIGDRFYRKNFCVENGTAMPDRLKVIEIQPAMDEDGSFYAVTGEYMYHSVDTKPRVFSSRIFSSGDWVIERKDIDFKGL